MKGILQEVSGHIVKIDNTYYDASQVTHFLPKNTGIEVEYSVGDGNQLIYIKPTGVQKASKPFTPKKVSRQYKQQPSQPKQSNQPSDNRGEKIAKQLLLKIADNKTNNFSYNSIDEALDALDQTYQKLKEKYLDELK